MGEEWGWAARGGLQLSTGLFGGSMSPRSASHKPRQAKSSKKADQLARPVSATVHG